MITTVRHLKCFGEPTEEDYQRILPLLNSDIPRADLFSYAVKLCDNRVDRQGEFFSAEALVTLKERFIGVTGIYDHKPRSDGQHSRIYHTELVTQHGLKNESGESYQYLVAYCYTLNNEENKVLINKIKSGILKEVSIGFKHVKPDVVSLPVGGKAKRISTITDAYEWSFVAIPAQPLAGVVKSFTQKEEDTPHPEGIAYKSFIQEQEVEVMNFQEGLTKLKGLDESLFTSISSGFQEQDVTLKGLQDEVSTKSARIKELEKMVSDQKLSNAYNLALSGFDPVSTKAAEMLQMVAEKNISLGDDGEPQGVEETRLAIKSDYSFLVKKSVDQSTDDDSSKDADGGDNVELGSVTRNQGDEDDEEQEYTDIKSFGQGITNLSTVVTGDASSQVGVKGFAISRK